MSNFVRKLRIEIAHPYIVGAMAIQATQAVSRAGIRTCRTRAVVHSVTPLQGYGIIAALATRLSGCRNVLLW